MEWILVAEAHQRMSYKDNRTDVEEIVGGYEIEQQQDQEDDCLVREREPDEATSEKF